MIYLRAKKSACGIFEEGKKVHVEFLRSKKSAQETRPGLYGMVVNPTGRNPGRNPGMCMCVRGS